MNYTGNKIKMRMLCVLIISVAVIITGCSTTDKIRPESSFFADKYGNSYSTVLTLTTEEPDISIESSTDFLYSSICYSSEEITDTSDYDFTSQALICYNISKAQVLYSKGVYDKVYPASTTKLLTALLAYKYGNLNDIITIKEDNCGITRPGAKLCGFLKGDVISLEELIKCLMVYSGNDAAVAIGEYISGDMDSFLKLMNKEAESLGATGTHFTNAHGLHDINHYTTAYDMYLIFNECIQSEFLLGIMNLKSYTANFHDSVGKLKELYMESTDLFLTGAEQIPDGVKIYGGKTGVTPAAGNCLMICSENSAGDMIITEVFNASTPKIQYGETRELINIANNDDYIAKYIK